MRAGHDLFRQNVAGVGSGRRQEDGGTADVAPVDEQGHTARGQFVDERHGNLSARAVEHDAIEAGHVGIDLAAVVGTARRFS